ncbi:AAA family ATPase [Brachyspira alvinipulli]|uniref:AAA family ATPase n=1 Tax=Brachyspira alvinipulli TaxID=84379 RepID=UPI00048900B5|nr:AAA family ATPase [Brachyspira alvinipulli]
MLLKFSLSNYRSFYNEASINFRVPETNNNPYIKKINNEYISKVCFLYGHNGCGKSNLINALKYIFYANNGYISSSNDSINRLLDPNMIYGKYKKSRFYIEFYSYDEYSLCKYELILDNENKTIYSEILIKDNDIIFERLKSNIVNGIFKYSDSIPDKNTVLSFFNDIQNNHINNKIDKYREESNYYISLFTNLCFLFPFTNEADFSSYAIMHAFNYFNEHKVWGTYKKLLNMADIDDLNIVDAENNNDFSFVFDNKKLLSKHDTYSNDFDEVESEGNKVYAINLIYILYSIMNGTLSILDEFNAIQSELLKFTVSLFKNYAFDDIEKETSQLILSTHDITLMSMDDMQLHNYFFINKENNMSILYSTDEIKKYNRALNMNDLEFEYRKNNLGIKRKNIEIPKSIKHN